MIQLAEALVGRQAKTTVEERADASMYYELPVAQLNESLFKRNSHIRILWLRLGKLPAVSSLSRRKPN